MYINYIYIYIFFFKSKEKVSASLESPKATPDGSSSTSGSLANWLSVTDGSGSALWWSLDRSMVDGWSTYVAPWTPFHRLLRNVFCVLSVLSVSWWRSINFPWLKQGLSRTKFFCHWARSRSQRAVWWCGDFDHSSALDWNSSGDRCRYVFSMLLHLANSYANL